MRLFISYTVHGGEINREILGKLKDRLNSFSSAVTYIDLLDNHDSNPQEYLMEQLEKSDILALICTKKIKDSVWVKKEISAASKKKIPVISVSLQDIEEVNTVTSYAMFRNTAFFRKIFLKSL